MSESNNSTLQQLEALLGNKNLPEGIGEILSMLQSSSQNNPDSGDNPIDKSSVENTLSQLKSTFGSLSSQADPRIDLINALIPFLNTHRKKKAEQCIRALRLSNLSSFALKNKDLFLGGS